MKILNLQLNTGKIHKLPIIFGILAVILSLLPAILLLENGYLEIHDQMDGEILVYILNSRNFFASSFPEFMNNMDATSLTPASYGSLLFYFILPPFAAFLCNYVFISLMAFIGMYLLLNVISDNKWLAALVAFLFSQLPFYSVYGLSVMGQPLLFYASLRLWKNKKPCLSFLLTALFAVFSSLVLIGFADFLLLVCFALIMQLRKHQNSRHVWLQTAILLTVYILFNFSLIKQILMPSDIISHKSELTVTAGNAVANFKSMLYEGSYHSVSLHGHMVFWAIFFVLSGFAFYNYWTQKEKLRLWGIVEAMSEDK